MKFTLSSLKKYLQTEASITEICDKLNNIGLEVENVHDSAKILAPFSVAQIISAVPHPESTKLQICNVNVGSGENLQIICGAKNARTSLKVAYAPIGSVIPANGMVIKKAKIAGIESNGMLCSAAELGLGIAKENNEDGIIEIDEKFSIGTKITEVFAAGEAVIEINVTPNRGDCLGAFGIARDLAAAGIGVLKSPEIKPIKSSFESSIKAEIKSQNCQYFSGFYIKNIGNVSSPKWLKDQLEAIGINSISAIVDITNYVMMQFGQPLHAYDADTLSGNIIIRDALSNEEFKSLKNIDYKLLGGELVIENNNEIVGVAGIIGGLKTAVSVDTKNIFLEAAFFDSNNISKTGRALNILSDARYRFERNVDLSNVKNALIMATNLILEICATENTAISQIVEAGSDKKENLEIGFDLQKIKQIVGIEIDKEFVVQTLTSLGFEAKDLDNNLLKIKVPSHRSDITIYQDLIEEIIRIYGLNKIESVPLESSAEALKETIELALEILRNKLVNLGFDETINYSFIDEKLAVLFGEFKPELALKNPIANQMNYMRGSLIAGILQNVSKNQMRGFEDLSLFEIGKVFSGAKIDQQKNNIAGVRTGANKSINHYKDSRSFDVFDVKKDIFDCLELLGFSSAAFVLANEAPSYYHPYRSSALKMGKNIIGYFGELHPMIAKKFDVKNRVNIFEILIEELPINFKKKSAKKSFAVCDLLPLNRDFAFILDDKIAVGDLLKTVSGIDKNLISKVNLFDIYQDPKLGENKKSIAFSIQIQPLIKTLTGEEIEAISQKVISVVAEKFGGVLRG